MAIEIFNRYENKYFVDGQTYDGLVADLSSHMKLDKHNKDGKFYSIYNVYYDTPDNQLIRNSLEKPTYKEKVRVRSYNDPVKDDDIVFVEVKKKFDGLVNKRRTAMTLAETRRFFTGERIDPQTHMNPQVVRELAEIVRREQYLKPKLNLHYERMAFFDKKDDDLRISFDTNIYGNWRDDKHGYAKGGERLLPNGQYIMEVKVRWAMPLWLVGLIDKYQILPISFSKYGTVYKNKLKKEILEYV